MSDGSSSKRGAALSLALFALLLGLGAGAGGKTGTTGAGGAKGTTDAPTLLDKLKNPLK